MRVLRANGCDMAFAEHGAGTPLVLIHGTLADLRCWAAQMEPLGQRHRVVAPSLRHYWPARWDGTGGGFTMAQHVADVAAFVEVLGAGPVDLLGHSRGGHVAFRVAQHHPGLVRALVLAEPGGALDATLQPSPTAAAVAEPPGVSVAEATARAVERIRAGDVEGGVGSFIGAVTGPGGWEGMAWDLKQMFRDNARTLLGQIDERRPPFSRADMEAIRAPTLLIGSGACLPPFARVLDAMERWIGGAARVAIPGTSHLMPQENPDAFNRAVLGFLAERGQRGSAPRSPGG
jgi:pimeloyl-ACP methyl ester carboxylesterase